MRWMQGASGALVLGLAAACAAGPGGWPVGPGAAELPQKGFFVDKENLIDGEIYPGAYDPARPPYRLSALGTLALSGAAADSSLLAPGRAIDGDSSTQWAHGTYRAPSAWWSASLAAPTSVSTLRVKTGPLAGSATYAIQLRVAGEWVTAASGLKNTTWGLETKTFPARTASGVRLVFTNDAARTHTRFTLYEAQALGEVGSTGTVTPTPAFLYPSATPLPIATTNTSATANPGTLATLSPSQAPLDAAMAYAPDLRAIAPRRPIMTYSNGRRILRFDNVIPNVGQGPFQVRAYNADGLTRAFQEFKDPSGRVVATKFVGSFEFHPAHNHFHLGDVALYQLRASSTTGTLMKQGYKVSFCLMDSVRYLSDAPASAYGGCDQVMQGVQRGWGDLYNRELPGQEFDVTDYPAGTYYLITLTDPTNKFGDPNHDNETAWLKVYLNPQAGTLQVQGSSNP